MNSRLERIWKIFTDLPRTGKIGIALWLIGYPLTLAGIILFVSGHYLLGAALYFLPYFEGNLGILLAGKEIVSSVRNEFFRKG